ALRWAKDEQIVLEANPQWWGGAPKVKTLIFRPIPEHAVRVAALQAGEVDVAVNIPPHLVPIIEKHPKLYVSRARGVGPIFFPIYPYQFDTANKPVGPLDGPTKDKRVRQAIIPGGDPDRRDKKVAGGATIS